MNKIDLINQAFAKADRLESKLTAECFSVGGFTSPKIRHFLNNLAAHCTNYLELGVHRGATFLAANYKNLNLETSTAIDSFVEFNEEKNMKQVFLDNMQRFTDKRFHDPKEDCMPSFVLLAQDCWTVEVPLFKPIDLFLIDGDHSYESQKKAVTYFAPAMADEFIICLDDSTWEQVMRGTEDGIKEAGLTIVQKWHKTNGEEWWNGWTVYLLRK